MLKKTWMCEELYVDSEYGFRKKGNGNEGK